MAEVRYLSKVYPNVSILDVAAALMQCDAPEVCDDGLFVPLVLQGNRRLKLPAALFGGDPVRLCEKLLLQYDLKVGISWAHTYAGESGKHALLNKRMQLRASPPAVLEPLFLVNEGTLRHLVTTLVLRLRMACSSTQIERVFGAAMERPWALTVADAGTLASLCAALAVATVPCSKADCTFVIETKGWIKCSPRDWTLLSLVLLSFKSYMGIDLSAFVIRIPELTSAAALLHPGPSMNTPQKRKAEDAPEGETGSKRAYNVFEWQEYTPEAEAAVTEFFGVPAELPGIKLAVSNPEGTKMAIKIDGCPEGTYNQKITIFDTDVRFYMPNVSQQKGGFSNPDKIAVKFMGDRGVKMGVQLRDTLAKSLAEASDLKKFLAPAERKQVKEMSAADRVQFFVNKINSGQYTIPVAIKERLNEDTGEVETEVGGIKARSGFARAKTGAKAEKLAEDVQANLTTDPGVYSAMQNIEGKEFSPPDVFDALGNRLTWDMLTDKGSKTQFACAAVVEVQILGANKIEQKSTMSTTFLSFPTKVSTVRILRLRASRDTAPKVDENDPRVAHF